MALQQGKVEYLRQEYETGKIKKGDLNRQEGLLQKMTVCILASPLSTMDQEYHQFSATAIGPEIYYLSGTSLPNLMSQNKTSPDSNKTAFSFARTGNLSQQLLLENV